MFLNSPTHLNPSTRACIKMFEINILIVMVLLMMTLLFKVSDFIFLVYLIYFITFSINSIMLLGNIINALIHRLPLREVGLIIYLLVFPTVIYSLLFL